MNMYQDKILHVDGDGFFAACEVARRPDLRGKPVVVGADRGIACAMTYEAKALGIKRAKPIFEIRKEFPQVIILPAHFELYEHYSENLYKILCTHLKYVEWYSIDECFGIMPASFMESHGSWEAALAHIKRDIQNQLGITFSFGLADTKVLAKVASKLQKPDGCTVFYEKDREVVLEKIAIGDIWGVGWSTRNRLVQLGIRTALDFIRHPEEFIRNWFHEPVQVLWGELRGKRIMGIRTEPGIRKSLQATRSFAPASDDKSFLLSELSRNIENACKRMRTQGLAASVFSVYLRSKTLSRRFTSVQFTLPAYTQNPSELMKLVVGSFSDIYNPQHRYRSTGVAVYGLVEVVRIPGDMFGFQEAKSAADTYLETVDAVQEKFGQRSMSLGSSMQSIKWRKAEQEKHNRTDSYLWSLPLPYMGEVS